MSIQYLIIFWTDVSGICTFVPWTLDPCPLVPCSCVPFSHRIRFFLFPPAAFKLFFSLVPHSHVPYMKIPYNHCSQFFCSVHARFRFTCSSFLCTVCSLHAYSWNFFLLNGPYMHFPRARTQIHCILVTYNILMFPACKFSACKFPAVTCFSFSCSLHTRAALVPHSNVPCMLISGTLVPFSQVPYMQVHS